MQRATIAVVFSLLLLGLSSQQNPLQIVTNYGPMDNKYGGGQTGTEVDKYFFSKQIMIRVVKYYQAAMTVNTPAGTFSYTEFKLTGTTTTVPAGTFTGHLYTVFDCYLSTTDSAFASAAVQDQAPSNGRPVSGSFHLNLNSIRPSPKNALAHYGTFVHEFFHILAFNSDLYGFYINSAGTKYGATSVVGTVSGRSAFILSGSKVIAWAQTYLGDNSVSSILLENGGGSGSAGSHWEYDYWPSDYMSPIDTLPSLLTPLSMYLGKDSGWYDVNDNYLDPMIYGAGAGANFQSTATCPGDRNPVPVGFCSSTSIGNGMCSPDGMYKGVCGSDKTYNGNGCPFIMGTLYCTVPSDDLGNAVNTQYEVIGPGSRCASLKSSGGGYTPACATTTCSGTSITYKFNNGATCTCNSGDAGNDISCGGLTVNCPATTMATLICDSLDSSKQRCPNDCSGKGFCLGLTAGTKQCWCKYGWNGSDCNTVNTAEPSLTSAGTSTGSNNNRSGNLIAISSTGLALLLALSSFW